MNVKIPCSMTHTVYEYKGDPYMESAVDGKRGKQDDVVLIGVGGHRA